MLLEQCEYILWRNIRLRQLCCGRLLQYLQSGRLDLFPCYIRIKYTALCSFGVRYRNPERSFFYSQPAYDSADVLQRIG